MQNNFFPKNSKSRLDDLPQVYENSIVLTKRLMPLEINRAKEKKIKKKPSLIS